MQLRSGRSVLQVTIHNGASSGRPMASIRFCDIASAQKMKQQVLQPAGGTQPMISIWNPSTKLPKAAVHVPGERLICYLQKSNWASKSRSLQPPPLFGLARESTENVRPSCPACVVVSHLEIAWYFSTRFASTAVKLLISRCVCMVRACPFNSSNYLQRLAATLISSLSCKGNVIEQHFYQVTEVMASRECMALHALSSLSDNHMAFWPKCSETAAAT